MKVLYFFFCYAHIPAQLRQKLAPRANRCFLKGHASAQKGSRCFDPSSRSRRPGMLPSMSTSSSTLLILVGAYWISIFWIFFTSGFSCASRASGGVRAPRKSGSPLLSSQHLHLALLIIKSSLHLYHLLVTTSCLRILLHPLSQQSHLHLCAC